MAFFVLCGQTWAIQESHITLAKREGSKSFDFEINQINNQAIKKYEQAFFQKEIEKIKKALNLSQQLREPSQRILYFNLSLSLHKSSNNAKASKQFSSAKRFARDNSKILKSKLMKMHECGFNPSIPCEKETPVPINIEGTH
jgi:hypothetical protein